MPTAPSSIPPRHPVIALITEAGPTAPCRKRNEHSDLGGRRPGRAELGRGQGHLAHEEFYGDVVTERHRHRDAANVNYLDALRRSGAHAARD